MASEVKTMPEKIEILSEKQLSEEMGLSRETMRMIRIMGVPGQSHTHTALPRARPRTAAGDCLLPPRSKRLAGPLIRAEYAASCRSQNAACRGKLSRKPRAGSQAKEKYRLHVIR